MAVKHFLFLFSTHGPFAPPPPPPHNNREMLMKKRANRHRSGANIAQRSDLATGPDSRTDEDSRLRTAAIFTPPPPPRPPSDRLCGHQQRDLLHAVLRTLPQCCVSVGASVLIHTAAQIPD